MKFYLATLCLIGCSIAVQGQTLKALAAQHKRYIGIAISPQALNEAAFTTVVEREIDMLTCENAMKWGQLEHTKGAPNYHDADATVAFAQAHNIKMRGHTLLWHAEVPSWLANNHNATDVKKIVDDHITNEVGRFKGKIYSWDVVNEIINDGGAGTIRNDVFFSNLGRGYVAEAFKKAHEVDPGTKLYINDYGIESHNKKSDAVYELVKEMKAAGVPVHGVGFQSHFTQGQIPSDFKANLQRFAALDVDVALTELDIAIPTPVTTAKLEAQGKDYETVFSICLEVPRCVGVTMWGLTDKYSWIPGFTNHKSDDALIFDREYKEKPAYQGVKAAFTKHAA